MNKEVASCSLWNIAVKDRDLRLAVLVNYWVPIYFILKYIFIEEIGKLLLLLTLLFVFPLILYFTIAKHVYFKKGKIIKYRKSEKGEERNVSIAIAISTIICLYFLIK